MIISKSYEFNQLIRRITETEEFCKMRKFKHHRNGNTYEHSIKVAYLCYRHYQIFDSKVELGELIRGALLHDYFLYDRHNKNSNPKISGLKHSFTHPKKALNNALNDYPDLTATEQDIIKRHMFPLTPIPPKTRGGWIVCLYDKVTAIDDFLFTEKKLPT